MLHGAHFKRCYGLACRERVEEDQDTNPIGEEVGHGSKERAIGDVAQ